MLRNPLFVRILAVLLFSSISLSASAGPIFEILGVSPSTLPHPSGQGTQSASSSFIIVSTGAGFLDGSIEFNDDFALPGVGGVTAFDETDLFRVAFAHTTAAFTGLANVTPSFSLAATNGPGGNQITDAVGQVVHTGTALDPSWTINFFNRPPGAIGPAIKTSVGYSTYAGCCGVGGIWSGLFGIDDQTFVLYEALLNGVGPQADQTLIVDSQYRGSWQLTAIPESGTATLLGLGLVALGRCGRARSHPD